MTDDRTQNGLRRGKPLERKTPLSRGSKPLERGTRGLSPGKGLQRRTPLDSGSKNLERRTPLASGASLSNPQPDRERKPATGLQRTTPLISKPPAERNSTPPAGLQRRSPLSPGAKGLTNGSSGLAKGGGLTTRTLPASRTADDGPTTPPKRIPQQSKKRQAELPERRRIVAAVLAIEPTCLAPHCNNPSQDGHERKTRARGGSTLSVSNVVGMCRLHNLELTDEPAWGYETGLLLHSWDDEPTEPLWWLSEDQKAALVRVRDERWSPKSRYEVELWYEKRRAA